MQKRSAPTCAGVMFALVSFLIGPGHASAITLEGCELVIGATCTLAPVQVAVDEVDGNTSGDPRIGQPFAKVSLSVTALDAQEFEYRYRIVDHQFTVTNFLLNLSLIPREAVLAVGSIPDSDPTTVAPLLATFDQTTGIFSVVFINPSITTASAQGSDVLFVRSTHSPDLVVAQVGGSDQFNALLGTVQVHGPAGTLSARPIVPEQVIAQAGPDQTVDEGETVHLDGTSSSDPQDDPLNYEWTQIAGASVVLFDPLTPTPSFVAPYVEMNEVLTFQLVVNDGLHFSDPDTVDVTVTQVNHPPVADAGDDGTIKEGAQATLDGSNSFDPEGDPITYTWVQVAGPQVTLTPDNTVQSPSFVAPAGAGSTLVFKLQVSDGKESSMPSPGSDPAQPDTVAVTVVVNSAPVADAGADQTKDEGSLVTLDGTNSMDADGGDLLSFQWTQTSGSPVTLSGAEGPTPTFEAPFVSPGGETLVFELVVTDDDPVNPLASSDDVIINVRNVSDPPTCGLAEASVDGLWPPNHKMQSISIEGVMADGSGPSDIVLSITGVTQDEPVNGDGDGNTSPDAVVQHHSPMDSVMIRSERAGGGNGRVYEIHFMATDGFESCTGSVKVVVPKNRTQKPIDDGQQYDSTQP